MAPRVLVLVVPLPPLPAGHMRCLPRGQGVVVPERHQRRRGFVTPVAAGAFARSAVGVLAQRQAGADGVGELVGDADELVLLGRESAFRREFRGPVVPVCMCVRA